MPAAFATPDSVIADQSRVSSNSRMPSKIESRSSTRDASAYGMRCAVLEPFRSPRAPQSRGLVTRATVSRPVASLARPPSRPCNLHHLEVGLGRAAVRAAPVVGNVVPSGGRGEAVLGPALGLVVLEAALHADEKPVVTHCLTRLPLEKSVRSR